MYIADDADIGMAEDCRALIFIDRDYKPGLAYAGDMLGCSPDAQRDVKPGRNRAARQADLLLFRQPALVGNVTRGANGGIEQARQLIDRLVVFRPSQAHTHADNRVGRFQLSHPRILELEAQAACADPRGDVFRWESFNNRFAAGVGDGGMEHAGAQRRHRRDGVGENGRDNTATKGRLVLHEALLSIDAQIDAIARQAKIEASSYARRQVAPVSSRS